VTWLVPILVVLAALMDGFYDNGKKLISSIFKSLFIGGVAYGLVLQGNYIVVIYFFLCWWVLFDVVYNITRGLGLVYVGSTKWTDKILRWAFRTNAPHFLFITKLMALAAAIAIIIRG